MQVIDSYYAKNGYTWSALTLIEGAKDLEEFDYPLAAADLSYCWSIENTYDFIYHMQRVQKTDDKFPILLDDKGIICDGRHRICKAILAGKETIKAKRFNKMPPWDSYTDPNKSSS